MKVKLIDISNLKTFFFLERFLVESLFSYFLVFFYKFPPQVSYSTSAPRSYLTLKKKWRINGISTNFVPTLRDRFWSLLPTCYPSHCHIFLQLLGARSRNIWQSHLQHGSQNHQNLFSSFRWICHRFFCPFYVIFYTTYFWILTLLALLN